MKKASQSKARPAKGTARTTKGATVADLAAYFFVSVKTIYEWLEKGIIKRVTGRAGYDLDDCRRQAMGYFQNAAANKGDDAGNKQLAAARSRWTRAKAEAAELDNRVASGKYVLADDCEAMLRDTFAVMRAALLGTAGKIADIGAHSTREELFELIDREVREALTALAEPASYVKGAK